MFPVFLIYPEMRRLRLRAFLKDHFGKYHLRVAFRNGTEICFSME